MIHSLEDIKYCKQMNIQFMTYKSDTSILYSGFKVVMEELKNYSKYEGS